MRLCMCRKGLVLLRALARFHSRNWPLERQALSGFRRPRAARGQHEKLVPPRRGRGAGGGPRAPPFSTGSSDRAEHQEEQLFRIPICRRAGQGCEAVLHKQMPQEFMGLPGASSSAAGKEFTAYAMASSPYEVDMVVLGDDGVTFKGMDSLQQLRFAELCKEYKPDNVLQGLFIADYMAVCNALPNISLTDRAFTLDLLILTFVHSNVIGLPPDAVKKNLQLWERSRVPPVASSMGPLKHGAYDALDPDTHNVEDHVESALLLLSAATFQTMSMMHEVAADLQHRGLWLEVVGANTYETQMARRLDIESDEDLKDESFIMEHLKSGQQDVDSTASDPKSEGVFSRLVACHVCGAGAQKVSSPVVCARASPRRTSDPSAMVAQSSSSNPVDLLKLLVRHCIHTSADYVLRRSILYEFAASRLQSGSGAAGGGALDGIVAAVLRCSTMLPLAQRCFETGEGFGLPATFCKSYSMDALAHLDGGTVASSQQVLESLGYQAVEYKVLATNSKSGEFFFISDDKRFLIKTISVNESILLQKMLTSYQHHIRKWPHSLIVRYAGLFNVEAPSAGLSQYFIVMRSVFDPAFHIHETYDLKGSLFNRRKKEGESIGKDEDWISAKQHIATPSHRRHELYAMHELDVELLRRFDVMDYSLLVGVHHIQEREAQDLPSESAGYWQPGGGVLSEDQKTLYFVGLIDFLIMYDLGKQTENFIRVVQGHGEDASCVSPPSYAKRQAVFIRDRVLTCGHAEPGTLGRLQVEIISAENLVAADWIGTSDPYVRVTLGLLHRQTDMVRRDCNPRWGSTLFLPVNESHTGQEIELSVWDWDANRALRGSDDFLGKLIVPMQHVLRGPVCFLGEPLLDVSQGQLSVRLTFQPLGTEEPTFNFLTAEVLEASDTEEPVLFETDGLQGGSEPFI
eukprot:CAMPEP_0177519140 /NCGR_PEP_ID=MMETSP0369-20130122/46924_1 /TAXON_ID=447022 ORGANISM="Scrippsiella hangoei-like, Strain SHHI-4" /NCGR_SAMPLE_ID=MMETSP0369 /ASSEMBLY_ACC=CAM_ASM_000364 /LENGTH=913 /DNA_ID=CAMNT_0018998343 /DNA_START=137 /DNA_END=2876 /DNA_ORIENTATION=+